MSNKMKYELWDLLARICAVIPPLGATLFFFPEWLEKSPKATFSGMLLVSVFVCMIPFWKKLVALTKSFSSTAMPVFWLVIFGVFFALKDIVDKVIYISLFGLLGSVISMAICFVRNKYSEPNEKKKDEEDKEGN